MRTRRAGMVGTASPPIVHLERVPSAQGPVGTREESVARARGIVYTFLMNRAGKLIRCAVLGLLLATAIRPAMAFDLLAGLGTNNFAIFDASALYAQTATNLTLNAPFSLGQYLVGDFTTIYDWSAVSSFGLLMSAPGASPNTQFSVEFYDTATNLISEFQGFASGLGTEPTLVALSPGVSGTEDFSAVSRFYYSWGDGGSSAVQIAGIVPEPSTWALLGFSALLVGFFLVRNRKRA